jgi:CheY-like chemotaxis protein
MGDESGSNPSQGKAPLFASRSPHEDAAATKRYRILVVDDNGADQFLIREALRQAHIDTELETATDGEKAIQMIARLDQDDELPSPDLILLDLNLPRKTGSEVLQWMKKSRRCASTPVIIVTSSDSERDHSDAVLHGASAYFRKPSSFAAFMKLGDLARVLLETSSSSGTASQ